MWHLRHIDSRRHEAVPAWRLFPPRAFEVSQLAEVMHLHSDGTAAPLTRVGLEPLEQLCALGVGCRRSLVDEDCILSASYLLL